MPTCGIIILAAGGSSRLGTPKQSLLVNGTSLLNRAVTTALQSVCRPVVVVLGCKANELRPLLHNLPVEIVINDHWQQGIGSSIRRGMHALTQSPVDATMITLCDQPLIDQIALNHLVDIHFTTNANLTAAHYNHTLGTPAIFAASLFNELSNLKDNEGGKTIINRHKNVIQHFPLPEAQFDIDTPADARKLTQLNNSRV